MLDPGTLRRTTARLLGRSRDPANAAAMAAYMKTTMPFYGVRKRDLVPILARVVEEFPASSRQEYEIAVRALWELPHREERYLAIGYARHFGEFIDADGIALYEFMIVDGAWWDLVDEVAIHLVGGLLEDPAAARRVRSWIVHEDLWLRRSAIICQTQRKRETDTDLLYDACLANLQDGDFFIRKAIGWALRAYSRSDPEWVGEFVERHGSSMSGVSLREARKHLPSSS